MVEWICLGGCNWKLVGGKMKTCGRCKKTKPFKDFPKNTEQGDGFYGYCKTCRSEYRRSNYVSKLVKKDCGVCGEPIKRRATPGKDGIYRCNNCARLRRNVSSSKRMNAKAAEFRRNRKPKSCDICGDLITDKRATPGKDGIYRCSQCQAVRNRKVTARQMREVLKGPKAEQYRRNRNRGKKAWEERNPEGCKARSMIKSVNRRLKQYGYEINRFRSISSRELAAAIMNLPKSCQTCGTDEDLTIEHIKPISYYPELAFDVDNLTTLCRACNTRSYHVRNG